MNRTLAVGNVLKALGPTRSVNGAVRVFSVLLDHIVRPRQHVRRNRQADLLCCFQIDDKLELFGLFHREIGRLGTFQNFVHISSGTAYQVIPAHSITHKPTSFHKLRRVIYRRKPVLYRKFANLFTLGIEYWTTQHQDGTSTFFACSAECRLDVLGVNHSHHLITLSALASTLGGIVRPICLAASRLMMKSNFFGCSTGRSAGFVPLRILSTYTAARRDKSGRFTP